MQDQLLKFGFTGARVRGELVQLANAWREMTVHRRYPPAVMCVLGEMVAAAALLASNIKFNGALVMQIYGDGPLQLLVVECQSDLALRATAKVREEAIADDISLHDLMNRQGRGRFSITLDPKDPLPGQQPYQGIVALEGDSVAEILQNYMRQSEQLETRLWLASNDAVAAGLLLQRLPSESGSEAAPTDDAAWEHLLALGRTVTAEELLELSPADIAHRLFWQESLEHYPPVMPRFQCTCSRERIAKMLISLGPEEVDSIVAEQGSVTVTCEFCGRTYGFDPVDTAQLFAAGVEGTIATLTDSARH
ncbi:MAG TPA: Hsp33 family molecular chaperone HslO [Burkholderiaceae bacterium]|nr:Hsp33 family molecular chaperone HslO [Burkholderiaceae bacterium]